MPALYFCDGARRAGTDFAHLGDSGGDANEDTPSGVRAFQVPSDDLRQTALRVVEREAAHLRPDVRIESRIGVVPRMAQRSA